MSYTEILLKDVVRCLYIGVFQYKTTYNTYNNQFLSIFHSDVRTPLPVWPNPSSQQLYIIHSYIERLKCARIPQFDQSVALLVIGMSLVDTLLLVI